MAYEDIGRHCTYCKATIGSRATLSKANASWEEWSDAVRSVVGSEEKPDGFWDDLRREYNSGDTALESCYGAY